MKLKLIPGLMIMQTARVLLRLAIRQRSPPALSTLAWNIFLQVQPFSDCSEIERRGALRNVFSPLRLLGQSLEHVERLVVVLAVVLVQRRPPVLGQRVGQPFASLLNVGLASGLPALDEEHLHVVVGESVYGRGEALLDCPPLESFQEVSELSGVQKFLSAALVPFHGGPLFACVLGELFGRFHEAPLLACSGFGRFAAFARCDFELGSGSGSGFDLDRGHGQRLGENFFFLQGVQEGGFSSATARGTAVGGRLVGVLVGGTPLVAIAA